MKEIVVTLPGGLKDTALFGTKAQDILEGMGGEASKAIAVFLNNQVSSVHSRLEINTEIAPIFTDSPEGSKVYRRSLCFLLAIAARELFPSRRLVVGHSLGNGYFYSFDGEAGIGQADLEALAARMREIVAQDHPIHYRHISYTDAVEHFARNNQPDTALLLSHLNAPSIPVNECRTFMDLSVAPLAPSTGFLKSFELIAYKTGFLLRYPHVGDGEAIAPFEDSPVLYSVYAEYKRWGKILGVSSVGALNEIAMGKGIKGFIQVAEALQNKKIAEIADKIAEHRGAIRVVLIAGPSSSGKTTFSKKLAIQLKVLGYEPRNVSLDDYFINRDSTPLDEKGEPDFECLEALDVELLNDQILALLAGKEVELPRYDFKMGRRKPEGQVMRLGERDVLIIEGIHGLNEKLTHLVPRTQKFKIYISALTQLNLDDHNRVPTTDNRVLRRMVRDHAFRGHSASTTLKMWPSVQRGERRHIFPYQNSSDVAFNSALDYELAVLKVYAEPLLKTVKPDVREYSEAARLLAFLENFAPIHAQHVPGDSILREFIGGSDFRY
jgi:uridine kinase